MQTLEDVLAILYAEANGAYARASRTEDRNLLHYADGVMFAVEILGEYENANQAE